MSKGKECKDHLGNKYASIKDMCASYGEHITVEFMNRSSAFQMPQAFETGFLQSEYPDFLSDIKKMMEVDRRIMYIKDEIEKRKEQLDSLII